MTYIKDLIDLPDRVRRGDFVLRLSEGVTKPRETVESYVVTPQLVKCFDEALALIRSGLQAHSSKACYLHGSFGSGKSHFMAILYLILTGNTDARSILELAPVVSRHNEWTEGKKFLLIPYHMIGAENMESAILGGYADHIVKLHPDAPTPGVFRAEKIFADAENLRATMGDAAFFARLNERASGGWGDIERGWDAGSFSSAINAPPKSEDRIRLVGDLVERFFTAARGHAEFVSLDEGLSIISKHARDLGYEGLILFLDELILWLATHAGDVAFVNREGPKVSKLVEAQSADRPVPIISFVARQRDLKELVGEGLPGADKLNFSDILDWWEARFSKITLEDRNLPDIAAKRVLKPKSEAARQMMDEAFRTTERIREEVMNVLLTSQANRDMFRKVYPFSPALVETLVAVSFMLQRERTALKVMLQLLVEQRDRLKLGDIVPVGDLFDAISEGDEAFSEDMKTHFENAKKLYHQKLRPLLELEYGIRFEELEALTNDDQRVIALRNDDRLVKTLLLSALAPNVESLRGLTVNRLAALNHGTIKSPIEGREGQLVLQKVRKWAAEVGQIKIGDETNNPPISVQLTGVDTESIIQKAQAEDNSGNRVRKIKELLFGQLGIEPEDELFLSHDFTWRATKRSCDILVGNVREMTETSFRKDGEQWRVILDYPFDTEGHSPKDDLARLEVFRSEVNEPCRTLVWLPSFLSMQAKKELGTLVKLDYILTGERFAGFVTHLSPVERNDAKTLLTNQRDQLRQRMIRYLDGAYGIAAPEKGSIDSAHELTDVEHFQSLDESFSPQPPVAANLKQGFENFLDQALQHQFPSHPLFEGEANLSPTVLKRVYVEIERATQDREGRIAVEQPRRKELRQVANPLKLGEMHETHFLIGQHWRTHFQRKEAQDGGPITVAKLRTWIDQPSPMGLPRSIQNLVIMVFAAQTNHSFFLHGGPVAATIDNLSDDTELRQQRLPSQSDWVAATQRAASIFGVPSSPLLNAANVSKFVADVKEVATDTRLHCEKLVDSLRQVLPSVSEQGTGAARFKTAQTAKQLVDTVLRTGGDGLVEAIVKADLTSAEAMGTSLRKAEAVVNCMSQVKWSLLEGIRQLSDHRQEAAEAIWESVKDAFEKDEYAVALEPVLRDAEDRAVRLLTDIPKTPPQPGATQPGSVVKPRPGAQVLTQGSRDDLSAGELDNVVDEIRESLESDSDARLRVSWEVYKK